MLHCSLLDAAAIFTYLVTRMLVMTEVSAYTQTASGRSKITSTEFREISQLFNRAFYAWTYGTSKSVITTHAEIALRPTYPYY